MDTRTDLEHDAIMELYSGYDKAYFDQVRRKDVNKHSIRRRYLFCLWRILQNNKLL